MRLIDAHCHLDFSDFDHDREAVIERANKQGIEHIVIPGVEKSSWAKIANLCEQYSCLSACYGLHPYRVDTQDTADTDELSRWLTTHDCVAVGECGLDYREGQAEKNRQQYFFEAQLDIAQQIEKPVVIHSVHATQKVIDTLKNFPAVTGMVHSYSGSYEQALQLVETGFYLSFGGAITHTRASRLRDAVKRLPLESILLETDAPDQADASHENQRNEPAYLSAVIAQLAELRSTSVEDIARQATANTIALFGLEL